MNAIPISIWTASTFQTRCHSQWALGIERKPQPIRAREDGDVTEAGRLAFLFKWLDYCSLAYALDHEIKEVLASLASQNVTARMRSTNFFFSLSFNTAAYMLRPEKKRKKKELDVLSEDITITLLATTIFAWKWVLSLFDNPYIIRRKNHKHEALFFFTKIIYIYIYIYI